MKKLLLVALLIGICMGPVYKVCCKRFCWKDYGKHEVFSQKITTKKINGKTIYSKSNAHWNSPIYFSLKPSMNPIVFVTEIQYYSPIEYTTCRTGFLGRLSKNNSTIWQEELTFSGVRKKNEPSEGIAISIQSSGKNTGYQNLKTFSVDEAGKYKLLMVENLHSDLAVSKVNIIVKGNLRSSNKNIIKAGFGLIGTSILLLLLSLVISKKQY